MSEPGGDGYSTDNLPYGAAQTSDGRSHVMVRIGAEALSLTDGASRVTPGDAEFARLFTEGTLDRVLAAGHETWTSVRASVQDVLRGNRADIEPYLHPVAALTMQLPFAVADYVDFYASEHHATNVGRIFRPGGSGLTPNWKHIPIGYHGRAGTVVPSGTPVQRPCGQSRDADGALGFGPSRRLDFEAEVGFVVGTPSRLGTPVPVADFAEHVFGVCLLDDWSARDIQAYESAPLGPFLGKSFATSISAWITPLDALSHAWVAPPPRDPAPADYLDDTATSAGLDLALEVRLNGELVARGPYAGMYWTPAQMLAHMTVNGASLRTGDLFGSGTVSGPGADERACLLERTRNGAEPITLADGTTRAFLEDGDEVLLTATAPGPNGRIALGEVRGTIEPAQD